MKLINLIVFVFIFWCHNFYSQNFEWAKGMGGFGQDEGYSIAVDTNGYVYSTGFFSDTVDFDPGLGTFNLISKGNKDVFISKLDSAGNFIWAKSIGGISIDCGVAIILGDDGSIYITGIFYGTTDFDPNVGVYNLTSNGGADAFILKLSAGGSFEWAKKISGMDDIYLAAIDIDELENIYITGYFKGTYDFDPGVGSFNLTSFGTYDIFISKLDNLGNFIWAKQCGKYGYHNGGSSIKVDINHNVYVSGYFDNTVDFNPGLGVFDLTSNQIGSEDIFVLKLDSLGEFVWVKQLGGIQINICLSIDLDSFGGIYTTGYFRGTSDFDPGVGTYNLTSVSGFDVFVSKLNVDGDFIWAKNMGGSGFWHEGYSLFVTDNGNTYITGLFDSIVDFDPGAGTYSLTSTGEKDVFISKLDSSGNFVFARKMGGIEIDNGRCILVDRDENIYIVGDFNGTGDFDPTGNIFNLTAVGLQDVFVVKLSQSIGVNVIENELDVFLLFPNPTLNEITLHFKKPVEQAIIRVLNGIGEVIKISQTSSLSSIIELPSSKGIYFIQVEINGVSSVYKILKQ